MKRPDFSKLDARTLALVRKVGEEAHERGLLVHLVGGVVRDLLLGRPSLDVDCVVEGDGVAFARALSASLGGKVVAYPRFGTATIYFLDGTAVDIVTARRESYARPGALPDVQPGTLQDDLFRRDFTINALAVSLLPGKFGVLRDDHHGLKDLEDGRVRILHDRSFVDDPTRILRAARYEARFGFKMDRATLAALKQALRAGCFSTIAPVRYWNEFRRILEEEDPLPALERLAELEALGPFPPEARRLECVRRAQQLAGREGRGIGIDGKWSWHVLGAAFLAGLGCKEAQGFLTKMGVARDDKRKILDVLQNARLLDMLVGNS